MSALQLSCFVLSVTLKNFSVVHLVGERNTVGKLRFAAVAVEAGRWIVK